MWEIRYEGQFASLHLANAIFVSLRDFQRFLTSDFPLDSVEKVTFLLSPCSTDNFSFRSEHASSADFNSSFLLNTRKKSSSWIRKVEQKDWRARKFMNFRNPDPDISISVGPMKLISHPPNRKGLCPFFAFWDIEHFALSVISPFLQFSYWYKRLDLITMGQT